MASPGTSKLSVAWKRASSRSSSPRPWRAQHQLKTTLGEVARQAEFRDSDVIKPVVDEARLALRIRPEEAVKTARKQRADFLRSVGSREDDDEADDYLMPEEHPYPVNGCYSEPGAGEPSS